MYPEPIVFIVEDNEAVRDGLCQLLSSVQRNARGFETAQAFLDSYQNERGCLVVDIRLPGMSGLELQEILNQRGIDLPVLFTTAHADVAMAVRAMKGGAFEFLEKPVNTQVLLDRIHQALEADRGKFMQNHQRREMLHRISTLSKREREVLQYLVAGVSNQDIGNKLNIGVKTVETHRSRIMKKMDAVSLADLVRIVVHNDLL